MDNNDCLNMCGGILFDLLLETRKQRSSIRSRKEKGTDNLSDIDIYCGMVYLVKGEKMDRGIGDSLKRAVSQYKTCKSSKGEYVPFTDSSTTHAFKAVYKNNKVLIYERIEEFKNQFLNEAKCDWLVRAIIETMQADRSIDQCIEIEVRPSVSVKICLLHNERIINFYVFLASILEYVVSNCPDCERGKDTFQKWYSQEKPRTKWKYTGNVGTKEGLDRITCDFNLPNCSVNESTEN